MTNDEIYKKLCEPFKNEQISWRIGATNKEKTKALALAYIDSRDVMDRLDAVMGYEGWQTHARKDGDTYYCQMTLLLNDRQVTKTDGAGATEVEGEKGGISSAFKRAAVAFGIGRYLYDLTNVWVEIEPYGRTHRIKPTEFTKLNNTHENAANKYRSKK